MKPSIPNYGESQQRNVSLINQWKPIEWIKSDSVREQVDDLELFIDCRLLEDRNPFGQLGSTKN